MTVIPSFTISYYLGDGSLFPRALATERPSSHGIGIGRATPGLVDWQSLEFQTPRQKSTQ